MLFVFKLGPVRTKDGVINAYLGIRENPRARQPMPVLSSQDADGLRRVAAEEAHAGEALRCEPSLAETGSRFGFIGLEAPDWVLHAKAIMAATTALGGRVAPQAQGGLDGLLREASRFWEAEPWNFLDNDLPLRIKVTGALKKEFEGAVMGSGGLEYGLALYQPGALERINAGVTTSEDSLTFSFDDEPEYAVEAVRDMYGVPLFPFPLKVRDRKSVNLDREDLELLSGIIAAVSSLIPEQSSVSIAIELGRRKARIEVSAPDETGW